MSPLIWTIAFVCLGLLLLSGIAFVSHQVYKSYRIRRGEGKYYAVDQPQESPSIRLPNTGSSSFLSGDVRHVRVQPLVLRHHSESFSFSGSPISPNSPLTPTTATPKTPIGTIDPDLYTFEDIDDFEESHKPRSLYLGRVQFTVMYDIRRSVLTVRLIRAINLTFPTSEQEKPCNPYAIVQLLPDYRHQLQSNIQRKTSRPNFDQKFEFEVDYDNLKLQTLWLTVLSLDSFSRHEMIGQVVLPLEDIEPSKENAYLTDLQPSLKEVELGEIMISLGYLKSAERLTVVIVRARNLPAVNIKGTDPYVKVSLLLSGKKLKKRKTSTKKGEINPVFNEAIAFDVSADLLDNVDLLVGVMHGNDVIGCVLIGSHATGEGLRRWKEVQSEDRPLAHWYELQDPKMFY